MTFWLSYSYVKDGPRSDKEREHVRFFIPSNNALLCQPALCCHAVLTFPNCTFFLTGWEASDPTDATRAKELLRKHTRGVRRVILWQLIQKLGISGSLTWCQKNSAAKEPDEAKRSKLDLEEPLSWLEVNGLPRDFKPTSNNAKGRPTGLCGKKKSASNLPCAWNKSKLKTRRNDRKNKIYFQKYQ